MNFASDNGAGAAQEILAAIAATSRINAPAYGADDFTAGATAMLSEVFETKTEAFLVTTGTAANALALASLAQPFETVFCHDEAHIHDDECGAPEFFTGGAKLVGIGGEGGKLTPDALRKTLERFPRGLVKTSQPGALSLSQVTEAGTAYTIGEIAQLCDIAHGAGIGAHMDGARFANAIAATGASPAQMTWRAGIRRAFLRRDQERRPCLRGGRLLRSRTRGELRISAQARRAYAVQGAVSRRPDAGLSAGRPVAQAR